MSSALLWSLTFPVEKWASKEMLNNLVAQNPASVPRLKRAMGTIRNSGGIEKRKQYSSNKGNSVSHRGLPGKILYNILMLSNCSLFIWNSNSVRCIFMTLAGRCH